jgi:hypothetical protein
MDFNGFIIGIAAFLLTGIMHPIIIKAEFHFGKGIWPLFLVGGCASLVLSLFVKGLINSTMLALLGFLLLWSIRELHEQGERVKKGWFPANPKRKS